MTAEQPDPRTAPVVRFGPYRFDRREKLLFREDETVPLTPKALEILDVLLRHAGSVVEKEELMRSVWPDTFVDEANLSHHVFTLRRALGDENKDHQFIQTVPRRGYRFAAPIESDGVVQASRPASDPPPEGRPGGLHYTVAFAFVALALAVGLFLFLRKRPEPPPPAPQSTAIKAIAVLPFRSLVTAQQDEPLEIGMTDALINRLSAIRSVVVRPMTAVRRYAEGQTDPLKAGRDLGVDAVVEGSVQRVEDRLRVRVRLLRVSDGTALWVDQLDQRFTDIFAMQDSISNRVASSLEVPLSGAEQRALTRHPTADPIAYDLYLKGRFYWSLRTPQSLDQAWTYFRHATDRDPRFALGWVGLCDADLLLIEYNGHEPAELLPKAKEAVEKALLIDDQLAEAHVSRAVVREVYERDWRGAEESYKRALVLNPNYATGHQWYGEYLMNMGRFDEAIAELDRALELDPLSLIINSVKGVALYLDGRNDEAARQLLYSISLDPGFVRAHIWLGMVYEKQGKSEQARAELERAIALAGDDALAAPILAHAYAASGRRAEAEKIVAKLTEVSRTRHVNGYVMASIYVELGDYDRAFHWLDRAFREYDNRLSSIRVDPHFDSVRGDPRYAAFVENLKLPGS